MALHPQNSNYTSPLRRVHQSWHTQAYPTRPNNQPYTNGIGETLDQNSKTQSSSLRFPHRTSLRLSRISKFEALDALGVPIRLPSKRPAHLQLSRGSISGKGTDTSHTRRLSTIFSPVSDNRDQYTTFHPRMTSLLEETLSDPLDPKNGFRRKNRTRESFENHRFRSNQAAYGCVEAFAIPLMRLKVKGLESRELHMPQKKSHSRRRLSGI